MNPNVRGKRRVIYVLTAVVFGGSIDNKINSHYLYSPLCSEPKRDTWKTILSLSFTENVHVEIPIKIKKFAILNQHVCIGRWKKYVGASWNRSYIEFILFCVGRLIRTTRNKPKFKFQLVCVCGRGEWVIIAIFQYTHYM